MKTMCNNCNGAGVVETTIYVGEEGMKIESDVMVTCPECDGTGMNLKAALQSSDSQSMYDFIKIEYKKTLAEADKKVKDHQQEFGVFPIESTQPDVYDGEMLTNFWMDELGQWKF